MATTELTERDITKKMLEDAASDMSAVMKFEDAIPTGKKVVKAAIQADVIEAAGELRAEDVLKPKTVEVLMALGVKLPVSGESEVEVSTETVPEPDEPESDKSGKVSDEGKSPPETKKKTKTVEGKKTSRMAAIVQAMVNGTDIFDNTMAEVSNGLAATSNIKEQTFWLRGIRQFVKSLNENGFEIIESS